MKTILSYVRERFEALDNAVAAGYETISHDKEAEARRKETDAKMRHELAEADSYLSGQSSVCPCCKQVTVS